MKIEIKKLLLTGTALVAVSTFGAAAQAATITPVVDTTLVTNTGTTGTAAGAPNTAGGVGGASYLFGASNITLTNNAGTTQTGGVAGANGATGNGIMGVQSGFSGYGIYFNGQVGTAMAHDTLINNGAIFGGSGIAGADGNNSAGGGGGAPRQGVDINGAYGVVTGGTSGTITGGVGGNGGAGNGVNEPGGFGYGGGNGVAIIGAHVTYDSANTVNGGQGGAGGTSTGNAANSNGGEGGYGIFVQGGTNDTVTIEQGGVVAGGLGGAAGTGGSGAAGAAGITAPAVALDGTATIFANAGSVLGRDAHGVEVGGTVTSATNTGTISTTTSDAVYVSGTLSDLENTGGHITATTGDGIYSIGELTTLNNAANSSITVTGDGGHGIFNDVYTFTYNDNTYSYAGHIATLTNAGTLSVTTNGFGIDNVGTIDALNNSGTITVGNGSDAIDNTGTITALNNSGTIAATTGVAILNAGTLTITNSGIIRATTGTALELAAALSGALTNTGGTITSASTNHGTVYVTADLGNQTITGGTISNTSTANTAMALNITAAQTGTLALTGVSLLADGAHANSGDGIAINDTGHNAAITLDANSIVRGQIVEANGGALTLTSSAAITGNITTGNGNDALTVNGGALVGAVNLGGGTNSFNINTDLTQIAAISTSGAINTAIGAAGGLTINDAASLGTGTLSVANGGTLTLAGANLTTTGAFTNQGTTTLGVSRTLSVGSLNAAAGNLVFTASNAGSTLETGHINTGGTAADLLNQTVHVNYIGGDGITASSRSLIASGTGAATAPNAAVIDNSYLYNFTISPGGSDPNDLYLQTVVAFSPQAASDGENNSNASAAIFGPGNTSNPQLGQIQTNLENAPTRAAYNNIVQSTEPTVNNSNVVGATSITSDIFDLADSQLTTVDTGLQSGIAAGNQPVNYFAGLHPWAQAFGSHEDQSERSDVPGYNANTFGGALGVDTRNVAENTVLGLSFGYGRTHANSENANDTDTNVDTYQLMLYGNHDFAHNYFLTGMGAFGWDHNDETRHNVGAIAGLDAGADYNAWQGATRWELGRNFKNLPTGVTLTPSVIGDYLHYHAESYTEKGAGGADLSIDSQNEDILNLGLGLQAEWLYNINDAVKLRPNVHASYKYDVLNDDKTDTTGSFTAGGGAFSTNGLNPSNSTFDVGFGVKLYSTASWDFTGTYDYTFKPGYDAHSGLLRAAYKF